MWRIHIINKMLIYRRIEGKKEKRKEKGKNKEKMCLDMYIGERTHIECNNHHADICLYLIYRSVFSEGNKGISKSPILTDTHRDHFNPLRWLTQEIYAC